MTQAANGSRAAGAGFNGSVGMRELVAQHVAVTPNCADQITRPDAGKFFSQPTDVEVNDLPLWLIGPAIKVVEEGVLRQQFALAQHQQLQD